MGEWTKVRTRGEDGARKAEEKGNRQAKTSRSRAARRDEGGLRSEGSMDSGCDIQPDKSGSKQMRGFKNEKQHKGVDVSLSLPG
jgi:hypothetical protein